MYSKLQILRPRCDANVADCSENALQFIDYKAAPPIIILPQKTPLHIDIQQLKELSYIYNNEIYNN
jgi:hypothetical protein